MEQQSKHTDADNNKCNNHNGVDTTLDSTRLESIAEEEQRRSGETTPNSNQKILIEDPCDYAKKVLSSSMG